MCRATGKEAAYCQLPQPQGAPFTCFSLKRESRVENKRSIYRYTCWWCLTTQMGENLKSSFLYKFIHLHSYKKQIAAGVVYILLHLLHWKQSGVSQISTAPAVVNSAQYKHPSRLLTRDAKWTPALPNPPGASDNRALPPFPASELAGVSRSGSSSGEPPGFRWPLLHYLPQNERRADDGIGIQKREHASNKNERF